MEKIEIGGFVIEPQVVDERMYFVVSNAAGSWQMRMRDDDTQAALLMNAIGELDDDMRNYIHTWLLMVWSMIQTFPDAEMLEDFNKMVEARIDRIAKGLGVKEELTEDELAEDLAVERMREEVIANADKMEQEALEEVERNKANDNDNA